MNTSRQIRFKTFDDGYLVYLLSFRFGIFGVIVVEVHAKATFDEDIEYPLIVKCDFFPRPVKHVECHIRGPGFIAIEPFPVVIVEYLLDLSGQVREPCIIGDGRSSFHVCMHLVDEETVEPVEGQVDIPGVIEHVTELHLVVDTCRLRANIFGDIRQLHADRQAINIQRYQLRRGVYLGQVEVLGIIRCLGQQGSKDKRIVSL